MALNLKMEHVRLGLCCQFKEEPIKFSTTTAAVIARLKPKEARLKLSTICHHNARALTEALAYCAGAGIGCFRVSSRILPLKTHPQFGYELSDLPEGKLIIRLFEAAGDFAKRHAIRTVFHPDQFVLLSSASEEITERSVADLIYHAQVSEWIGADVINIHGGGAYGNKKDALERVMRRIKALPASVRSRLTLENDDTTYTPSDLLPVCQALKIPLVYDVHHHRCLPCELSIEEATQRALSTWDREALFHISSPKEGWQGPDPLRHHDYIDPADIPSCWQHIRMTLEVEAKAKEQAIYQLQQIIKY